MAKCNFGPSRYDIAVIVFPDWCYGCIFPEANKMYQLVVIFLLSAIIIALGLVTWQLQKKYSAALYEAQRLKTRYSAIIDL